MRNWFRFDWKLLKIANSIKDNWKRLEFLEAIINFGICWDIPQVQGLGKQISEALIIIGHDITISEKRSDSWKKWWAKQGNTNAQKENTQKRNSVSLQDSTQTQTTTQTTELSTTTQPEKSEKQKARNTKKHDENVELIDRIKAKVESLWLIYKSGANERINATNINKSKKFKSVAERFNMTSEMLAIAVIEISMSDKFRAWKITNCEMIYRHYDKIINNWMKMQAINQNSIWVLPWA